MHPAENRAIEPRGAGPQPRRHARPLPSRLLLPLLLYLSVHRRHPVLLQPRGGAVLVNYREPESINQSWGPLLDRETTAVLIRAARCDRTGAGRHENTTGTRQKTCCTIYKKVHPEVRTGPGGTGCACMSCNARVVGKDPDLLDRQQETNFKSRALERLRPSWSHFRRGAVRADDRPMSEGCAPPFPAGVPENPPPPPSPPPPPMVPPKYRPFRPLSPSTAFRHGITHTAAALA